MNKSDYLEIKKIAEEMLNGTLDIVVGTRAMNSIFQWQIDMKSAPEVFIFFNSLDSETEKFPKLHVRKHYNKDYLDKLDKEEEEIFREWKDDIIKNLKKLIEYCDLKI
jgi:transcription termination factor NusB